VSPQAREIQAFGKRNSFAAKYWRKPRFPGLKHHWMFIHCGLNCFCAIIVAQTHFNGHGHIRMASSIASETPQPPAYTVRVIKRSPTRDEIQAEVDDPYLLGWEAGENLDEPPPNPYKEGLSAKLWRNGYASRVEAYVASKRRLGLNISLTT
jgi:hypothetical protein